MVSAAKMLRLDSALLDGEVAAVLPNGRTSFHAMQTRSLGGANLAYFIFDILHLDGEDLLALPVEQRKERLRGLLGAKPPAPLRYVDHVIGGGADFFAAASRMRLEGMISKSRTEPYRPGARHRSWQKTKCQLRQEFVVGGWQPSVTGGLGSMILGYYDDKGHLTYAGKVGTGHQRQEKDSARSIRAPRARDASVPRRCSSRGVARLSMVGAPLGRRGRVHRVDERRSATPELSGSTRG